MIVFYKNELQKHQQTIFNGVWDSCYRDTHPDRIIRVVFPKGVKGKQNPQRVITTNEGGASLIIIDF